MPLSENMNVCFWAEGEISARPSQKEPKNRHFLEQVHSTVDMTYYRYVTPIVLGTYITRSFQKRRKAQTLDPMAQKLVQARGAHFYHIRSSTYIVYVPADRLLLLARIYFSIYRIKSPSA